MAIQIDTLRVQMTADNIAKVNNEIENQHSLMHDAIKKMTIHWKGDASSYGIGALRHILQTFRDARYASVNQLVAFLNCQVNEGYEAVERATVSAADLFK